MAWPQITMIVFMAFAMGVAIAKHGEPKGNHSAGQMLLAVALEVWILYEGGFFRIAAQ